MPQLSLASASVEQPRSHRRASEPRGAHGGCGHPDSPRPVPPSSLVPTSQGPALSVQTPALSCLDHRGAPLPVQPRLWAQGRLQLGASSVSSSSMVISVPSRPFWIRAPVSILPRLVAPVLDSPSASYSCTQSYKYALPLYHIARVLVPSVLPYSRSINLIPPVGSIAQRTRGPIAQQDGTIRGEEPHRQGGHRASQWLRLRNCRRGGRGRQQVRHPVP